MSLEMKDFGKEYSEERFWNKVLKYAKIAGRELVEKALWLFFAAQSEKTPVWAKTVIYGALGYFIFPADAIPDLTPIVGFSDDLGVIVAAVAVVAIYIDEDVKKQAAEKLNDWFGDDVEEGKVNQQT